MPDGRRMWGVLRKGRVSRGGLKRGRQRAAGGEFTRRTEEREAGAARGKDCKGEGLQGEGPRGGTESTEVLRGGFHAED